MPRPKDSQSLSRSAIQKGTDDELGRKWVPASVDRDQFFNLALDMLCIAGDDGYFKWLNAAFTDTLGWTTDELLSRPFVTFIHPDDHAATLEEVARQMERGEKVIRFQNRYQHKDGSWRTLSWKSVPHDARMYAVARDVTERNRLESLLKDTNATLRNLVEERTSALEAEIVERKDTLKRLQASERQLRLLISNIKDYALYMLDVGGTVISWNAAAERIKGYGADEIVGKDYSCFFVEEDKSAGVPQTALDIAACDGRFEDGSCLRVRKDGSVFWASVVIYPIVEKSEGLVGYAKITRDITAETEAKIKNAAMQKRLEQAQKMEAIGQLTGGIAHDFNNLLTVILANADVLAEDIKDQDLRGLAAMIREAAERGADLTNSLLAFARRQSLEPKSIDANKLLLGMDSLLHRALGEQIEIELIETLNVWHVMVDPTQLETAILNLALNARDAMPNGGNLTIETSNTVIDNTYGPEFDDVERGEYVLLCVSDTGTGMSPETVAHAFEPFYTTKESGKGTGLGLSMVYGFVKQSGGQIKIYSEIGHGTTFKIYLRRSMESANSDETKMPADSSEPGGTETILMVEDDDLVRAHVEQLLKTLGYSVLTASSGAEALKILEGHGHVDLLFTDVVMPGGMSGRQLADKVAALYPSLPILFTSGYTQNVIVHHGRLDEGVQLLRKPYRRRDLALKLRQIIGAQKRG